MVTEAVADRQGGGCGGTAGVWVSVGSPGTDGHAWGAEDRWVAIKGLGRDWIGLLVLPVLVP